MTSFPLLTLPILLMTIQKRFEQRPRRGRSPVDYGANLYIHMSLRPYIHPYTRRMLDISHKLTQASHVQRDEQMNIWTDRRRYRFSLYSTELHPLQFPQGRCPPHEIVTITKYQNRARLPMTISCLWATGFYYFRFHKSLHQTCFMLPTSIF